MSISKEVSAQVLAACCLAATAAVSLAQPITSGSVLTTRQGRTLYVFDNDVPDSERSVCTGPCVGLHPPYLVEKGAKAGKPFGTIRRDDGTTQWTYKGRPLYRFYADEKRGDANGDGLNRGTWHVAKP